MNDKIRRFDKADHLALRVIGDHAPHKMGASCRSLWLAMETLAWEQRQKHHGRAFVTSQPNLAKIALISVPTVKRLSAFFEHLGLLTVTNRKTSACRWDFNHYALKYPSTVAHDDLRKEAHRSSHDDKVHDLVLHSKGGAKLRPAASAASPLTLRRNSSPHSGVSSRAVEPDKSENVTIKKPTAAELEAAAKAEEERLAAEEAEQAERKERERIENEQRLERIRKAEEKRIADEEAAKRAEDARRLAMRTDVASCVAAIHRAVFDEYDPGTLPGTLVDYDRSTFHAAVGKLLPDMSDKLRACIKNNEWMFE